MKKQKHSKRFNEADKLIDKQKTYSVDEAVDLIKKTATTKFDSSVEIHFKLGIDTKKGDQAVRGNVVLPHGSGKTKKIAIITTEDKQKEAKAAGADIVGMDELAAEVKGGMLDFDVVIASPDAMRVVGQLGQILGPKGLMPNPKTGTVTPDVATAVNNAKAGQVRYRTDRNGIIHGGIGKIGFDAAAIKENLEALIVDLKKAKPASSKGHFLKKITLSTTMGPGLLIDLASLEV